MSFTELQVSWVVYLMMQKSRMMIDLRFGPLCCVAKVDVLVKYLVSIGCTVSLHVNPPLCKYACESSTITGGDVTLGSGYRRFVLDLEELEGAQRLSGQFVRQELSEREGPILGACVRFFCSWNRKVSRRHNFHCLIQEQEVAYWQAWFGFVHNCPVRHTVEPASGHHLPTHKRNLAPPKKSFMRSWIFILCSVAPTNDIFPLGCCDHRFSDRSSFSLCFFNLPCSQPSHSSTGQGLINCRSCESFESNCDPPYIDNCPLFH